MSSYDQNLLGEAPRATRAQLQQGYSVDLLEQPAEPPRRTPSLRSPTPHVPQSGPAAIAVPLTPAIPENSSGEKFDSPVPLPTSKPKTSFWRTRNGIITLAVLALVVIGAVVGGAVGGTVGKKSNNTIAATNSTSSHSTVVPASTTAPATAPVASVPATTEGAGQASGTQQNQGTRPTSSTSNIVDASKSTSTSGSNNNMGG